MLSGFGDRSPPRGQPELAESGPVEGHAVGRHPSVSSRVQDPACFTLQNWSPPEDLHLTSPAYKAGAPLSVRGGQIWWAAQESHLDLSA